MKKECLCKRTLKLCDDCKKIAYKKVVEISKKLFPKKKMKLLEKLAIECCEKEFDLNLGAHEPYTELFEAGFKKARELAAEKFKNRLSANSRTIYKEILNIGEEDEKK